MNIMYKHIFLDFGVVSFINKEMASLFQLHTYKFGLVYYQKQNYFVGNYFLKCNILYDTSNITDSVFAIFQNRLQQLNLPFHHRFRI